MENEMNQNTDDELVYVVCKNCNFRVRVEKDIDLNILFELIYCCDDCDLDFETTDMDETKLNTRYDELLNELTNKQFMQFILLQTTRDDIIEEFSKIGMFFDQNIKDKLKDIATMTKMLRHK